MKKFVIKLLCYCNILYQTFISKDKTGKEKCRENALMHDNEHDLICSIHHLLFQSAFTFEIVNAGTY